MGSKCPYCESELPQQDGGKPRSYPQLKRYHAMVRRAFQNWPETHEMQFADQHECRKWLEMKAGYRELALQMPLNGIPEAKLVPLITATVLSVIRANSKAKGFAVPVVHKGTLYVWASKSISYEKLPHKEMCELSDKVEQLVYEITGVKSRELEAMENAA